MNFIFYLPPQQKIALSRAGLNVFRLIQKNGKRPPNISEILYTIHHVKQSLIDKDYYIIYDICESKFFKKTTLFSGIYCYKTNHIPERIISIIENEDKKQVVINRLDLMIQILAATQRANNGSI